MKKIIDWLKKEPAVASYLLASGLTIAAHFGFTLDPAQTGELYAVLVTLGFGVTRQSVTPTAKL